MSQPKRKKEQEQKGGGRVAVDVLLCIALLAGVGYCGYRVAAGSSRIDQTTTYRAETPEETTEPSTEETQTIFQSENIANTAVHEGNLMLVNNQIACETTGEEADIISLYEAKAAVDCHSFSVNTNTLSVRQVVADQLIAMCNDFYNVTFDDNIVVESGYRSKERQQELYDNDLENTGEDASTLVAKPGHSEHQSGYCVDLGLVGDAEYDGTGIYSWINENCYKYGFVLRFPESKTEITEIQYEPWHYRYVGVPHAFYMTSGQLCLEEYIELLKSYPYDGEHLMITDTDGKIYEVYYVAMHPSYDTTVVPLPSDQTYTISGNNSDGFIVTVDTGETGEPPVIATAAPTEDTTEAEETDASETEDTDEETE